MEISILFPRQPVYDSYMEALSNKNETEQLALFEIDDSMVVRSLARVIELFPRENPERPDESA